MPSMHAPEFASAAELVAGLAHVRATPADPGRLSNIIIRPDRDQRHLVTECMVTREEGIPGDRWARHCTRRLPDGALNPDTQLTLMNIRVLELLAAPTEWPQAGDNLLVELDLSVANLPVGQRLRIGEAVLEISAEPHTGCAKFTRRFGPEAVKFVNSPEGRSLRLRGVNASVWSPGRIRVGDLIEKI